MNQLGFRPVVMLAAFAAGCGGSQEVVGPTGTLKGKLTLAGKPVSVKVTLVCQHTQSGRLFIATTNESGEYTVTEPTSKMPTGRYEVTVQGQVFEKDPTEGLEPVQDGKKEAAAAPAVLKFPDKYRNAHESGLGFELEPGANERTFDMKM